MHQPAAGGALVVTFVRRALKADGWKVKGGARLLGRPFRSPKGAAGAQRTKRCYGLGSASAHQEGWQRAETEWFTPQFPKIRGYQGQDKGQGSEVGEESREMGAGNAIPPSVCAWLQLMNA